MCKVTDSRVRSKQRSVQSVRPTALIADLSYHVVLSRVEESTIPPVSTYGYFLSMKNSAIFFRQNLF